MEIVAGTHVGPYEVLERIGTGELWKARDPESRFVVLQILSNDHAFPPRVNHPSFAAAIQDGESDGTRYRAMENVEGTTLDHLIPSHGLPLREGLRVAVPLVAAVEAAHQAGVFLPAIQPSEVVVTWEGDVKVFPSSQTREGNVPNDIRWIGELLQLIFTGRMARGAAESGMPHDLWRIVAHCLRDDPTRRFQTAADLKEELEELQEEAFAPLPSKPAARQGKRSWTIVILGALGVAAVIAGVYVARIRNVSALPPVLSARLLTTYPGEEIAGSFSPDESQFAFSWNGETQKNFDIYTRPIEGGPPVRLTRDPNPDWYPAWSPDGKWIAFWRVGRGVMLISPSGEGERVVLAEGFSRFFSQIGWSPDSRSLVATHYDFRTESIFLVRVDIDTGSVNALPYHMPPSTVSDLNPQLSPDGMTVAFIRTSNLARSEIMLLPAAGGDAKSIFSSAQPINGLTWSHDGKWIVFSRSTVGLRSLWRVSTNLHGEREPERLAGAGEFGMYPMFSRSGRLLLYSRRIQDTDILHHAVEPDGTLNEDGHAVAVSVGVDNQMQFSPDGRHLAFASTRTGNPEIYRSDEDGRNQVQLTSFAGPHVGSPRWSPDGKWIVFDSRASGNADIYLVPSGGGEVRKMTQAPTEEARPGFSADSKWIYFRSDRSGRREIWKMPLDGGEWQQVTKNGAHDGLESADGRRFYFVKSPPQQGVYCVDLESGMESQVLARGYSGLWGMSRHELFWVEAPMVSLSGASPKTIRALSLATGRERVVGTIYYPFTGITNDMAVRSDGRAFLFAKNYQGEADLMLVENYR